MADEVKLTAKSFEPLDRSKNLDSEKNFSAKSDVHARCMAPAEKE